MALIPKKVVGSKGFNGFNVELVGLQEVINQVGLIGKVANKAFSEAAVAIGKGVDGNQSVMETDDD